MTMGTLKSPKSKKLEQYFCDKFEFFIRLFDEHFARLLKVIYARRDVILAGGLSHRFPWRHLPPP